MHANEHELLILPLGPEKEDPGDKYPPGFWFTLIVLDYESSIIMLLLGSSLRYLTGTTVPT